ncbi:unnamed protein product [Vitrella brassicaformis CCMP3155]|uniref:Uncharacterized protein n=1 Tax=Vitrella brassicaformis (strain CCMP3155) TaxID=1169540 RepID=A0A0G4F8S8_VITBC|nr:unnamed protein product [Vitrella brassicaformis CCMP3155]|eukprot:CEM08966.1 unnamed protein product [Vitrella brassicaformis CCMP3155]
MDVKDRPARPVRKAAMAASSAAAAAAGGVGGGGGGRDRKRRSLFSESSVDSDDNSEWEGYAHARRAAKNKKNKGRKDVKKARTKPLTPDDVEMEDVGEVGHGQALAALAEVAEQLQAQINMVNEAKAKAQQMLDAKAALPAPNTFAKQKHMQEVDRHYRVLTAMVRCEADIQISTVDKTAKQQVEACVKKLDVILKTMDKLNQHEVRSGLEELPEALWMTTEEGFGLGAYLGYHTFMTSLSTINTHFSHLSRQPAVHPIVDIYANPTKRTAAKLPGRVSQCRSLHVHHRPTPRLVTLLEQLAATIETVELQGTRQRRGQNIAEVLSNESPTAFPKLRKATVGSVWESIAHRRKYDLPVLKELSIVGVSGFARALVRNASSGLSSLHFIPDTRDEMAVVHEGGVYANYRHGSLTGQVDFSYPDWGFAGGSGDPAQLIDVIGTDNGGGPLRHVEMGLNTIKDTKLIRALHRFRTTCLSHGATESYHTYDGYRRREGLALRLPLTSAAPPVAPALPTLHMCCAQADRVTLKARASAGVPDLGPLVFPRVNELTIDWDGPAYDGDGVLPSYVTSDPRAMFPNVKSVWVKQRGGAEFFEGGAGQVLSGLQSIDHITFGLFTPANPNATLCLVPAGVAHLCAQGRRDVTVCVKSEIDFPSPSFNYTTLSYDPPQSQNLAVGWRVYGGDREAGRQVMASRVSRLEMHLLLRWDGYCGRTGPSLTDAAEKGLFQSFAECVVSVFESFPRLKCVVLSPYKPRPKGLITLLREASQKRLTVSGGEGKTILTGAQLLY